MKTCKLAKPGMIAGDDVYFTKDTADTAAYLKKVLDEEPETDIHIYGGDGSVFDAVNGIMAAGAEKTATLTVTPSGTGNDFVRNFEDGEFHRIDLIRVNDHYCANIVNIGFDCDVVNAANKVKNKPLIGGKMSYVTGVFMTLFKKFGKHFDIELTAKDGSVEKLSGDYLLAFAANGQFYGGGFHSASAADLQDGVFDVMLIKKVSRLKFISLVGKYKKGTHLDENGELIPSFQKFAMYRKCTRMVVSGPKQLCIDGEVLPLEKAVFTIVPDTLTVRVQKQKES